jgi:RHS repeat-associated protein
MRCIEVVGVRRERYDKNGNITKLKRYGDSDDVDYAFVIDDLQYTYDTTNKNRLLKVTDYSSVPQGFKDDSTGSNNDDPEDDYKYDSNGNLVADQNKDIENITYNHLNLPVTIKFATTGNKISYLYNAAGTKIRKIVSTNSEIITDYMAGGFQYLETKLNYFPHPEGYVTIVDDKFRYVYNYTDHLGNVRLSYSDANANGTIESNEIMEENNYYPFGLKHTAYNTNQSQYVSSAQLNQITLEVMPHYEGDGSYQYKYNGKEYQDELGLNTYAYGWRDYDPAIGRFNKMDRFSEKYFDKTPYGYAGNNPVFYVDVQGDSINVAHLRDNNPEALKRLTGQLEQFTGFTINVDENGNLSIATEKDKKGRNRAIVKRDGKGKKVGSKLARNMLSSAISNKDMVTVLDNPNGKSRVTLDENNNYTNEINLDSNEINAFIPSSDINPLTNDIGMTFLHELGHTPVGGGYHDPIGIGADGSFTPGPNVNRINTVRRQLGPSFGQRMIYNDIGINFTPFNKKGDIYSPYSNQSLNQLRSGQTPTSMYLLIKR